MYQRIAAVLSAVALVFVGLVVTAPTALADTPGCVTRTEFAKVERGFAQSRVHAIFDARGRVTSQGYGYQSREYNPCTRPGYGFVNVDYQRKAGVWRVTGKYVYWG